MKKKNWFKVIAFSTISLSCIIYIAVSLIQTYKVNNFVLKDSCVFENIETTHFTCYYLLASVPSYPLGENGQNRFESYNTTTDELTLVYVKDPSTNRYLTVYDKEHIITDPVATIEIRYVSDQETPLYEQAETKYASYTDSERYDLLQHSYLPPEDDNYTTWEEIYAHYYLTVFPEDDLKFISFPEYEWDKEAFRFAVLDRDTKDIIEVVYFERTDGIYCVEMNYPRNNEEIRNELYNEFRTIKIHADSDPIDDMYENLDLTETWADDNTLCVTAVNNSSYTIPNLCFNLNYWYTEPINGYNGGGENPTFKEVTPGEEIRHTFTFTDEQVINLKSCDVSITIYDEVRYLPESDTLIYGE